METFCSFKTKEERREEKQRQEKIREILDSYDQIDSQLSDIGWTFDRHKYSKEDFATKLESVKEETYGGQWEIHKLNQKLELAEILVHYQCLNCIKKQLLDNEMILDKVEGPDSDNDAEEKVVEVEAHLKADNGEFFLTEELLMKLQNQLANKDLGDRVNLEGFEYKGEGEAADGSGSLSIFSVICGD